MDSPDTRLRQNLSQADHFLESFVGEVLKRLQPRLDELSRRVDDLAAQGDEQLWLAEPSESTSAPPNPAPQEPWASSRAPAGVQAADLAILHDPATPIEEQIATRTKLVEMLSIIIADLEIQLRQVQVALTALQTEHNQANISAGSVADTSSTTDQKMTLALSPDISADLAGVMASPSAAALDAANPPTAEELRHMGLGSTTESVETPDTVFAAPLVRLTPLHSALDSDAATLFAALRTVVVTFTVTVPTNTDATGRSVHLAGSFPAPYPTWDPGGLPASRVDATHWIITLNIPEGMDIEYKYTLGDWYYVEKDAACKEIANRQLSAFDSSSLEQPISDTVAEWHNIEACSGDSGSQKDSAAAVS